MHFRGLSLGIDETFLLFQDKQNTNKCQLASKETKKPIRRSGRSPTILSSPQCLLLLLSRSVMSDSVRSHRRQPTRLLCPSDSPGKNTGVGCHFLLQCMKVKSESEVAQLCPTLSDPMDCSPPGSSVHGIFQARVLEWVATAYLKRSGELPLREEHPHRGDDI